jgi:lysozyme
MNARKLFDIIRRLKGEGLTQSEVDEINAALAEPPDDQTAFRADPLLIEQLKIDEGLRLVAYQDTVGVWTIGYGHTGPEVKRGLVWTREKAETVLIEDVIAHNAKLAAALPWVSDLDPVRRRVLQNMAFNLGIGDAVKGTGLLGFKNTLRMIQTGFFSDAAANMLQSKWAKQVKARAVRLSNRMRTGVE